MPTSDVFAPPRIVTSTDDCYFYHTMEIPGHGLVKGEWDLRGGVDDYLAGVDLRGKRVLEIGTASGFLCFEMERRGAEVVAYDLSPDKGSWDLVPYPTSKSLATAESRRDHIRQLNNGYWFCHHALQSRAKVVYGSVYAVPEEIGRVDLSTFGSVLLHVRDPFLALENTLRLTRETVVITDLSPRTESRVVRYLRKLPSGRRWLGDLLAPSMRFVPNFRTSRPEETWWRLQPELITEFIGVLGFENVRIHAHQQTYKGRKVPLFTVVGRRTVPLDTQDQERPSLPRQW